MPINSRNFMQRKRKRERDIELDIAVNVVKPSRIQFNLRPRGLVNKYFSSFLETTVSLLDNLLVKK